MFAVLRRYSGQGASEVFDALERNTSEVERLLRGVPGFVGYTLIRSGDGGVSVTVCQDKAGTDESSRVAAGWVRQNVPATVNAPEVVEGNVILHLG